MQSPDADTPHARGAALIKDGAKLIENFQDVIDDFNLLPLDQTTATENAATDKAKPPAPEIRLQGLGLKIWRLVQNGEAYIDDIIAMADEETSSVLAAILTLELKRLVKQLPGKRIAPL